VNFPERAWQRVTLLTVLLYPVSLVFRALSALRRAAYAAALLKSRRLPVPVIVVGNITVGGTGKTPLTLWLASYLARHGRRPGIVSRGHGSSLREPREVNAAADAAQVGDEPLLLAQRCGCPVWVGADRVAAAQGLLNAHPACDVLVSDDGLQHYALARDVEIALIDGERGFGNGFLLPAGPLREPVSRLRSVDAIVVNGPRRAPALPASALTMHLQGDEFYNLLNPGHVVGPAYFRSRRVHAVAGIGNPARFFTYLQTLGIDFEAHAFPDHHAYRPEELAFAGADAVLMTEKDAVKCARFASEIQWALRVDALTDPELGQRLLKKLASL